MMEIATKNKCGNQRLLQYRFFNWWPLNIIFLVVVLYAIINNFLTASFPPSESTFSTNITGSINYDRNSSDWRNSWQSMRKSTAHGSMLNNDTRESPRIDTSSQDVLGQRPKLNGQPQNKRKIATKSQAQNKQHEMNKKIATKTNDFNSADAIRPSENIVETFEWQRVSSDLLLFAAHYDPRLPASPRIVIVALAANYHKKSRVSSYGTCYVWYRNKNVSTVVTAKRIILEDHHSKTYSPSLSTCSLQKCDKSPYAVSFAWNRSQKPNVTLKIVAHVSWTTGLDQRACGKTHSTHNETIDKKDFAGQQRFYPIDTEVNFTVCVPPFFHNFNDYRGLVDMIEVNRMFGAQRFVFYNYSSGNDVSRYLRSYEADGIARVIPWPLPNRVDESQFDARKSPIEVHYFAQISAINDCLYRNMFASRFIVFTDLDELIVPRKRNTWAELIRDVTPRNSSDVTFASFYSVRNVVFRRDWVNDSTATTDTHALSSRTLSLLKRESVIYPVTPRSYKGRAKCIVTSQQITIMGIHFIFEFAKGSRDGVYVDEKDALMHHYRWNPNTPYLLGKNYKPHVVYDPFMHKFRESILNRTREGMNRIWIDHPHRTAWQAGRQYLSSFVWFISSLF